MFHVADCNHSYQDNANHNYAQSCNDGYMRESLSKRIKRYRKNCGLTQQQVGDALGISRVAVSKWESGDTKDLKRANLIGISKLFGVSLNELLGHHTESTEVDMVDHITIGGPRALPIISYVQAGAWREIVDSFPPGGADEYVKPRNEHGPHSFALYVEGDSMTPEFNAGDIIIVDPDISPNPGNYVIARNYSQEATFKKYRPRGRDADGRDVFELVPLNDNYATLRSDQDGAVIIGTVVEHIRILR